MKLTPYCIGVGPDPQDDGSVLRLVFKLEIFIIWIKENGNHGAFASGHDCTRFPGPNPLAV
jgi:hypothetical protein